MSHEEILILNLLPWRIFKTLLVTHFWSMFPFCTPSKYQETKGCWLFSGGINFRIRFSKVEDYNQHTVTCSKFEVEILVNMNNKEYISILYFRQASSVAYRNPQPYWQIFWNLLNMSSLKYPRALDCLSAFLENSWTIKKRKKLLRELQK